MWEIELEECCIIKMEGLQRIKYGFFTLDFATRIKNQTSGGFFVDGFLKRVPSLWNNFKQK